MVGITLFLAYIVQALLGLVIHYVKPSQPRSRPPQNYLHAIFGLSIICTAFYNVRLGYKVQWPTIAGRGDAPRGVNIAWWIWVVLLPVLYCAGLVFLRRQYREEKVKKELYTMDSAER
jgi:amino acid transporter